MHNLHLQSLAEDTSPSTRLRLPDFFIIGSAKCGTTTLYKYLCRHPRIFMSTPKEMSFFSKNDVYQQRMPWYAKLFADARADQLCGEASTTYTRWPLYGNTADRLAAVQPDARLIYLVRDPVERLFSFYAHRMRESVTATFEEFLANTPEAVDSGRYMTQIKRYLQFFCEEQILVLFTQDLHESPQIPLEKTRQFLDLPTFDYLAAGPIRANQGGGKYFAAASLTQTIRSLKRAPAVASVLNRVPAHARKAGYEWLANGPIGMKLQRRHQRKMSSVTPKVRQQILEMYSEEVEQLADYTGRCLADWKPQAP